MASTHVKHSAAFPTGAVACWLEKAGLRAADITRVAQSFSYEPEQELYAGQSGHYHDLYGAVINPAANRAVAEEASGVDLAGKFLPVPHHLARATSAYFPSGFADALVPVSDRLGEKHSATVMVASEQGFEAMAEVPAHLSVAVGDYEGVPSDAAALWAEHRTGQVHVNKIGCPHGEMTSPERNQMTNPFERNEVSHYAPINDEGQYSIWPTTNETPEGWSVAHGLSGRQSCVEFIEDTWTDMRPESLVGAMGNLAQPS